MSKEALNGAGCTTLALLPHHWGPSPVLRHNNVMVPNTNHLLSNKYKYQYQLVSVIPCHPASGGGGLYTSSFV